MIGLGQMVYHRALGIDVVVVGLVAPKFGGQILVDWDGTGAIRWWCEADEVTA